MNAYIHHLFGSGEPASAVRIALYGFVHMECLSVKIPVEMQFARATAPTQQRDPGPWEARVLLADRLANQGDRLARDSARARWLWLFGGYRRPSEALAWPAPQWW